MTPFYQLTATRLRGQPLSMADYAGMFEKVDVNGPAAHPLFRYLKQALPGVLGGRIKWNFTKFLIGRDGTPLTRFAPFTTPEKMEASIVAALTR